MATTGRGRLQRLGAAPRLLLWVAILLLAPSVHAAGAQVDGSPTYADLAPILSERCIVCHAGDTAPLGLRLDSFDAVLKGSVRGPVVKAEDPANSELIRRIKGISQPRMPMTGPPFLSADQIALFERWVAAAMPPGDAASARVTAQAAPRQPTPGERITYADVAPIFATRCVKCHSDNGLMGPAPEGYRLTSYAATLATADRVRVVPGHPNASELMRRIRGQARPRMPRDGPPYLSGDEIRLIEAWITQGAHSAEGKAAEVPAGATLRLHGTLEAGWKLDNLPLAVGPRTRLDKAPAAGDYVEVRGHLGESGSVEVERVRRR